MIARPVGVVKAVTDKKGFDDLLALIREEHPDRVVVGLPLTLKGEHGAQAAETSAFVESLRAAVDVPVELFDERFTSVLAGGDDARAAAHLLSTYLEWQSARR
jgi:putative Holliday junction resolvase